MKTLSDHHAEFLTRERIAGRSETYLRGLKYSTRRFLTWLAEIHGVALPERLTTPLLEAWTEFVRRKTTGKGLPLRPTSVAKQLDSDRVFLLWLAREGLVPMKISTVIPRIRLPEVLPTSVLTNRQMLKLLNAVETHTPEGHQTRAMLEMLYSSGVRVTELLSLDLEHVDLTNRQARVLGKGFKERIVHFGETATRWTESYLRAFRPLMLQQPNERALWLNRSGERLPYFTFRLRLLAVAERAALPVQVTAHTFRRSFTTELIRNGANLWHVKEALGHASVETLKPYTKLTAVDLKKTHARCHPREKDAR